MRKIMLNLDLKLRLKKLKFNRTKLTFLLYWILGIVIALLVEFNNRRTVQGIGIIIYILIINLGYKSKGDKND